MSVNPIHLRPAAGWTDDTVPTEIGRDYWRWSYGDPTVINKWTVDGVRDLASDFESDMVNKWQYADVRAAMEANHV